MPTGSRAPSPSRLANLGAQRIFDGFTAYREQFLALTRRAWRHFEERAWARQRDDATARLLLYREAVDGVEADVVALLGERLRERLVWVSMKAVYSGLIAAREDWDLAETFFNSITRRVFATVGVDPLVEFVDSDFDEPPNPSSVDCCRFVVGAPSAAQLCRAVLEHRLFTVPWADLDGDAALAGARIEAHLAARGAEPVPEAAEMLRPLLFHGKGAYSVGRLVTSVGLVPFVLALRNTPGGLSIDAVLLEEDDVSILFSFTRTYFFVDTPRPFDVVAFLRTILPRKRRGELYLSLGEVKQGKTELYRDMLRQMVRSETRASRAPGTPGLVMVVFAFPDYDLVFKVIRDAFPPEKQVSRSQVSERYQWVHTHDRAGRLVDAQSFEHLALPADRFEPDLLDELTRESSRLVAVEGAVVVLGQVYVERKVTPLNLYLRQVGPEAARAAVIGYGDAIADMAACNIFPGDLLTKNFGVTRHGRVAFYDYDELAELTDCRFREIPEATTPEQEMAAEPWYPVGPDDVFPEEFVRFLGLPADLRAALLDAHGELFTAGWWRGVQQRILSGHIPEFVPYPPERRLRG